MGWVIFLWFLDGWREVGDFLNLMDASHSPSIAFLIISGIAVYPPSKKMVAIPLPQLPTEHGTSSSKRKYTVTAGRLLIIFSKKKKNSCQTVFWLNLIDRVERGELRHLISSPSSSPA